MVMIADQMQKQAKVIGDFLLEKMRDSSVRVIVPQNYSINFGTARYVPETTAEGKLVFLFHGATITIDFKVDSTKFVHELAEKLREVR